MAPLLTASLALGLTLEHDGLCKHKSWGVFWGALAVFPPWFPEQPCLLCLLLTNLSLLQPAQNTTEREGKTGRSHLHPPLLRELFVNLTNKGPNHGFSPSVNKLYEKFVFHEQRLQD